MKSEKFKKYDLLIALGIIFGIFIILSYIIPVGYYGYDDSYNLNYIAGETEPVGLIGLFKTPLYSVAIFIQYVLVFLSIGALYAVMNKTGVYNKIVDKVAKRFSTHKLLFLIISIITFALLSSLSGLPIVLFTLVPFVAAIIMLLGFDKVTALVSTVGALLVGTMGTTYGNTLVATNYLGLKANSLILYKFLLLIILTFLLIMFVVGKTKKQVTLVTETKKTTKKSKKEEVIKESTIEIPFYSNETEKSNKSSVPLIVIFILFIVLSLVCMFNWYYAFGIEVFNQISASITEFKIGDVAIFSKILGSFTVIGQWGNYEFVTFVVFVTVLIGWVYGLKPSEFIDTFASGAKKMLKTAIYVAFACVIFAVMINSENGTISNTISNFFVSLSSSFNVLLVSLTGMFGGIFYNDYVYLINGVYGAVSAYTSTVYPIVNIVLQSSFGFAMLVLPVSTLLVAGLSYLNVSYTEWIKYIWKLLLQLFVIIILFGLILSLIV